MDVVHSTWTPRVQDIPEGDAVFAGWQETGSGEAFALYTIVAGANPFRGSTVSESTLRKMHLRVPETPPFEGAIPVDSLPGWCGECPVETQCMGPYRSRIGCCAFPVDARGDGMRRREVEHE
ncbi:hypothetical protein ANRL2_01000 [Anaerolineae bacterium]|nr:hypothetical protein ANRL2_01000 [Anaerolineae bacterium]